VFCPYHSNEEWRWLRDNDPAGFQRAIEIDVALRTPGNVVNRNLDQKLYVHRSCVPLAEALPCFDFASAGGSANGKVERRRRDGGNGAE
jgi:hypothetical protein